MSAQAQPKGTKPHTTHTAATQTQRHKTDTGNTQKKQRNKTEAAQHRLCGSCVLCDVILFDVSFCLLLVDRLGGVCPILESL